MYRQVLDEYQIYSMYFENQRLNLHIHPSNYIQAPIFLSIYPSIHQLYTFNHLSIVPKLFYRLFLHTLLLFFLISYIFHLPFLLFFTLYVSLYPICFSLPYPFLLFFTLSVSLYPIFSFYPIYFSFFPCTLSFFHYHISFSLIHLFLYPICFYLPFLSLLYYLS